MILSGSGYHELRRESIFEDLHHRDLAINTIAIPVLENGKYGAMIDPAHG